MRDVEVSEYSICHCGLPSSRTPLFDAITVFSNRGSAADRKAPKNRRVKLSQQTREARSAAGSRHAPLDPSTNVCAALRIET